MNLLYRDLLKGILSLVCSVNLWRLLGNNQQPEKQEVNENNKEEAKQRNARYQSEHTGAGVERGAGCDMEVIPHLTLVKCYHLQYNISLRLVKSQIELFSSFFDLKRKSVGKQVKNTAYTAVEGNSVALERC